MRSGSLKSQPWQCQLANYPLMDEMIATLCALLTVHLLLFGNAALASQADPLAACLKRTESDRSNCQSGCGMLLQSCYDEAIATIDAKADALQATLGQERAPACSEIAKKYTAGESNLDTNIGTDAADHPGWLSAELNLLFARQRLETIQLIQKMCK